MIDCSLCYFMNCIFRLIYNVIASAMEYPIVVFLFSILLAVALISNVHTAKLICDLSNAASRQCGINGTPGLTANTICSFRNKVDYGIERGPHTWNCSGDNQSPINIIDDYIQKLLIRELLTWNHYDDLPNNVIMENTGHTILVRANYNGNVPTLSGADLLASYSFVQICFRWSLLDNDGSEHMLNYKKFPLELQAMHRTGPTGSVISSYDLLILAYFFEISGHNPYLDPVIQNLHRLQKPGTKIEIPPFPLSYLCHQFRSNFYSYGGSITEPPCYQGAEWFIYPEPLAISERQLNEFRQILSSNGKTRIVRNARPVQNINSSRVVNLNEYNPLDMCHISKLSMNTIPSEESVLD
ncbi:putative carbonic anhydrase 3 [Cochliomyia hominivorax]